MIRGEGEEVGGEEPGQQLPLKEKDRKEEALAARRKEDLPASAEGWGGLVS